MSIITVNINVLVSNGSYFTFLNNWWINSWAALEVIVKSESWLIVPVASSSLDLIFEARSVVLLEDWWKDVDGLDFNGNLWEANLDGGLRNSIAFVHVFEPISSSEFEAWLVVSIINSDLSAIVTVVVNELDGLLDILNGRVEVFNAILDVFPFNLVFADLTFQSFDFDVDLSDSFIDFVVSAFSFIDGSF